MVVMGMFIGAVFFFFGSDAMFPGLTGFLIRTKYAFEKCSILLFIVLAMPRLGGKNHYWLNGLYEALCVIVVFPLIVALGARRKVIRKSVLERL